MINKQLIIDEMNKRNEIMNTFNKNYLLEAGAGAGKTTIIVQRIINHIISSDIDPANIVAITFTKAASTELAERIQLKALEYLKKEKDPKIINRLKSVDKIFTGTIHSFCDILLREMPFEANLTPGYEIIEDDKEFHNNIWYNFLRDKEKEYKDVMELLSILEIDYKELRTKAILALENPDIQFSGYERANSYSYEEIEKQFKNTKEKYKELEFEAISRAKSIGKLLYPFLEEDNVEVLDYVRRLYNVFGKEELDAENLYKLIHKKDSKFNEPQKYKELIKELHNIYCKWNNLKYNTCTDFINMVVDYKKENYKGRLTFNELLYRASILIKKSKIARTHFKNKYKYFYIDEFQDTDPIQAELILHLTDKDTKYEGIKYWHNCNPIPGSLFVVGDPKQSIYRFRRADITIYNQVKEMIERNGEVVYLDINFRSSNDICNWVQSTFKKKDENDTYGFSEDSTEVQAGFKRILSLWDDSVEEKDKELEDKQLKGVYKYSYPEKEDQEYVVDIIEDILENYYITDKAKKEEGDYHNIIRKVKPNDIMILTKANAETGLYLRALKDRGIPALLAGEKKLGETREVLNLFMLIDCLIEYRDNIKVVAALRNSFYIDLETIELFMEDNKNLSPFIFFKERIEEIEIPSIKKAFIEINKMNKLSRELSPIAFVETAIQNGIGIFKNIDEYNQLELIDANAALRQTVEILKSNECTSLYEIREELKTLISQKVKYELPLDKETAMNAVRVMNVHKAKGLEANIVFLVGADKKRRVSSSTPTHYVEKGDKNNNIGYMAFQSKFNTMGPNEIEKREREYSFIEAEIDRLLYVAATRAKSVLVVANAEEEGQFLYPLSRNIQREIKPEDRTDKKKIISHNYTPLNIIKDLELEEEILTPSYLKITPSKFESVKKLNFNKNKLEILSPKIKSATRIPINSVELQVKEDLGPKGMVYGVIVHRAIEILINKSNNLKDINEEIINYSVNLSINETIDKLEINKTNIRNLYPHESSKVQEILNIRMERGTNFARKIIKNMLYEYVKLTLNKFINNEEIMELFMNAERVFTELPFTIAIDENHPKALEKIEKFVDDKDNLVEKGKPILINGSIDLVIKSKDNSWTILDYKTDTSFKENIYITLKERYTSQLEGYKTLFEEILKEQNVVVDNLLIYSTYLDEIISLYEPALI